MNPIGIGIIGCGRIGKVHAASIVYHIPQARLVAVSDVSEPMARALADTYKVDCYTDYRAILAREDVDAVLVCSPTNTHADIAIEAARAGKHIFCEKPVDLTIEKILAVGEAAREAGVKLQVGFNRRFDHNHGRVRALQEQGKLGKVELIRLTSRDPEPPPAQYAAASGGLFIDMMIHDFDMAVFQAGSPVEEVYAAGACLVDPEIGKAGDVDTAIVVLKFKSGALCAIDNSRRTAYGYDQRVEVFGDKGMAAGENDADSTVRLFNAEGVTGDKPQFFFLERYMASFTAEMKAFIQAVVEDKPVPVGIREGLESVLVAIAAKKSWLEHRPVAISEIYQG